MRPENRMRAAMANRMKKTRRRGRAGCDLRGQSIDSGNSLSHLAGCVQTQPFHFSPVGRSLLAGVGVLANNRTKTAEHLLYFVPRTLPGKSFRLALDPRIALRFIRAFLDRWQNASMKLLQIEDARGEAAQLDGGSAILRRSSCHSPQLQDRGCRIAGQLGG